MVRHDEVGAEAAGLVHDGVREVERDEDGRHLGLGVAHLEPDVVVVGLVGGRGPRRRGGG